MVCGVDAVGVSNRNCAFHSCCECTQTLTVGEQELGSSTVLRGVRSLFGTATSFSCGGEGAGGRSFLKFCFHNSYF